MDILVLDGVLGGVTMGSLYELGEAYFSRIEPPADFMPEIAMVAVAGAVLCAVISVVMKRLQPRS